MACTLLGGLIVAAIQLAYPSFNAYCGEFEDGTGEHYGVIVEFTGPCGNVRKGIALDVDPLPTVESAVDFIEQAVAQCNEG